MTCSHHKGLGQNFWSGLFLLLVIGCLLPHEVRAHDFLVGDLHVIHPALPARSSPGGPWPVHMVISNNGAAADRLMAIETEFGPVRLRRPTANGGSEELAWLALPPDDSVVLAPGDLQGWIGQVSRAIAEGDQISGTLVFERAGRVPMVFLVDPAPADPSLLVIPGQAPAAFPPSAEPELRDPGSDILAIVAALNQVTGSDDLSVSPVALAGDAALVGFTKGDTVALAFLRHSAGQGWQVVLWSNDSLLLPASLTGLGVPRPVADRLRSEITVRLNTETPGKLAAIRQFPGTAYPETGR